MSWQEYVDSGLVGSGKISVAALIGQDQAIWAKSSNFPAISTTQIGSILGGFNDPAGLRAEGIRVGDDKVSMINDSPSFHLYKYITIRADDRSIYGKKGATGIMCIKTKQLLIIAIYDDKTQPGDASKIAEGIADYLISVGF